MESKRGGAKRFPIRSRGLWICVKHVKRNDKYTSLGYRFVVGHPDWIPLDIKLKIKSVKKFAPTFLGDTTHECFDKPKILAKIKTIISYKI